MRKQTLVHALALSLLLLIAAVPASATFQPASCGEVSQWVEAHQDQLPTTLAEFESVPEGYQAGVFKLLAPEVRSEMWTEFLGTYVAAQPELSEEAVQRVRAFEAYFADPTAFSGVDGAEKETLAGLLSAFTLHLVDPVTDLVLQDSGINHLTIMHCNCNRNLDFGCMAMFCMPVQTGCGPSGLESCTGTYGD